MTDDDLEPMAEAIDDANIIWLPESGDYSTDVMNERYAVVLAGSKAVILWETPDGEPYERHRLLLLQSFHTWFANRFTKGDDGKLWTWSKRWMSDRRRRQFQGIEFVPDPHCDAGREGWYNLWKGFEIDPRPGDWSLFSEHLLDNVCSSNEQLFIWVLSWFAHIVQRPRERIGTSLVLRGGQGAGKTFVGETFGKLIAGHYFLVDDPRYITGQFNAHMASCLLLQADEGFWAGDKHAEGRLKGLVTSDRQMIEQKGIDAIPLANYVRLLVTSNEDWVVPGGKDERRFAVIDVGGARAKDGEYFGAIRAQMEKGGYAGLLHDLLNWDLDDVDLRTIPKTAALLDQKLRSLDSIDTWWLDRLMAGEIVRGHEWTDIVPTRRLSDDYCKHAEIIGIRRKSAETELGMRLKKLVPGLRRKKVAISLLPPAFGGGDEDTGARPYCYILPSLEQAREQFDKMVEQPVDWVGPGP